jgi:uncharacterized protein (DUF488 family)
LNESYSYPIKQSIVERKIRMVDRLAAGRGTRSGARPFEYFTVGHSTRSVAELADMLRLAGVGLVVDVRSVPRSRTNPQFNFDALPASLAAWQIGYRHIRELGGLRGRRKDQSPSANTWWENLSFRNYADYAATPVFRAGLAELLELGRTQVCAVMCAEAVWWRCHRRIIADYLISEGEQVFHIMGPGKATLAILTPAAVRQCNGTLIYPAAPSPI